MGYIVSNWEPRVDTWGAIVERYRYTDEPMYDYLTDMAQTMHDRGYGWCDTDWMGSVGIAYSYPLVKDSTYTQVAEHLYVDEEMSGWFREINNAS